MYLRGPEICFDKICYLAFNVEIKNKVFGQARKGRGRWPLAGLGKEVVVWLGKVRLGLCYLQFKEFKFNKNSQSLDILPRFSSMPGPETRGFNFESKSP